jgi:lactam utilization protein B
MLLMAVRTCCEAAEAAELEDTPKVYADRAYNIVASI